MDSQTVRVEKKVMSKSQQQMRYAVNLCCVYGVAAVGLHLLLSILTAPAAGNSILYYCLDIISALIGSLVPALALAYLGKGIGRYIRIPSQRKSSPFDSFVLVVFGIGACMVANMLCTILSHYLPDVSHRVYVSVSGSTAEFILMMSASAIAPAIFEEIACRGYLYGIMARYGHLMSVVLSSFIFGLMHSNFNNVLFAFICGFLFGCIRKTSNRLWIPVVVHFVYNSFFVISVFVRIYAGSDNHEVFLRIWYIAALCLFMGGAYALYKRKIPLLHFGPCPFPLQKRDKFRVVLTMPTFWVFIAMAVLVKFI